MAANSFHISAAFARSDLRALHPQDTREKIINLPRVVTMNTASNELSGFRLLHTSKHQLIPAASTAEAGHAMHTSTKVSELSFLLLHRLPSPYGSLFYLGKRHASLKSTECNGIP
jgi:hypothetical protein